MSTLRDTLELFAFNRWANELTLVDPPKLFAGKT